MESLGISLLIAFLVLVSTVCGVLIYILYRTSFENPGIISRSLGLRNSSRTTGTSSSSSLHRTNSNNTINNNPNTIPEPLTNDNPNPNPDTITESLPHPTKNISSSSSSYASHPNTLLYRLCCCQSNRRKGSTVTPSSTSSTIASPSHRQHNVKHSNPSDPSTHGVGAVISITNPEDSGKLPENKVRSPRQNNNNNNIVATTTTGTNGRNTLTTTTSNNTLVSQHNTQGINDEKDKYGWLNKWDIPVDKLRFKYLIGKGNFGEVYLGTWLGSPVAIKTILPNLQSNDKLVNRFMEEIALMASLHHPNVVLFLGACTKRPNLAIVLEYCVHGSLHHFLKSTSVHGIKISMSLIYRFALDIARGVYYLHRRCNVIQRDLKARNILVDGSLNAKVADFGLSRVVDEEEANKLTACGTPAWTAPEIVKMERYTEKVDVYSFGIIMWELIAREEPYGGQKGVQIAYAAAEQGLRPEIPSFCPTDFAELMRECWSDDPEERPTFAHILKRLFQMKKNCDRETAKALANPSRTTSHFALEQLPKFVPTNAGGAMIEPRARRKQRLSTNSSTATEISNGGNQRTATKESNNMNNINVIDNNPHKNNTVTNTENNKRIPSTSSNQIASSTASSQKTSRKSDGGQSSTTASTKGSKSPTNNESLPQNGSYPTTIPGTDNNRKVTISPEVRTVTDAEISRFTNIDDNGTSEIRENNREGKEGLDTRRDDTPEDNEEGTMRTEDSNIALLSRIGYAGSMRTNDEDILAGELEEGMTLDGGRFMGSTNIAQDLVDQGIVTLADTMEETNQDKWDGSISSDEETNNKNKKKDTKKTKRTPSSFPSPTRTKSSNTISGTVEKGNTVDKHSTVSDRSSSTVSSSVSKSKK